MLAKLPVSKDTTVHTVAPNADLLKMGVGRMDSRAPTAGVPAIPGSPLMLPDPVPSTVPAALLQPVAGPWGQPAQLTGPHVATSGGQMWWNPP